MTFVVLVCAHVFENELAFVTHLQDHSHIMKALFSVRKSRAVFVMDKFSVTLARIVSSRRSDVKGFEMQVDTSQERAMGPTN